jgi:hypothetical protein
LQKTGVPVDDVEVEILLMMKEVKQRPHQEIYYYASSIGHHACSPSQAFFQSEVPEKCTKWGRTQQHSSGL